MTGILISASLLTGSGGGLAVTGAGCGPTASGVAGVTAAGAADVAGGATDGVVVPGVGAMAGFWSGVCAHTPAGANNTAITGRTHNTDRLKNPRRTRSLIFLEGVVLDAVDLMPLSRRTLNF